MVEWLQARGEMADQVRAFDWAATPLGPAADWPAELRTTAAFVLENNFPAALVWGDDLITIFNDGFAEILRDKPLALGRSFAEIWADAWPEIGPMAERAFAGESTFIEDYELTIDRGGVLEQAWFTFSYSPVRTAEGSVVGMVDTVVETTDRVRAQAHQRMLLAELQHRVRNTLGVVRSIARRTAQNSASLEDASAHFDGRLEAFARVQSALTRNPAGGVDFTSLVEDELVAHAAREGNGVSLEGPELAFATRAAETMSLAIHELTTNAVKYGALGVERGHLMVRWALADDRFEFSWTESEVPGPIRQPEREGFGLELLCRVVPYELSAETALDFSADGLRFTLSMPAGDNIRAARVDVRAPVAHPESL